MLKVFRDNLKKLAWILWAVIAVFILLVFVDFGTVNRRGSQLAPAASIGDNQVTWADFQRRYQLMENRYRSVYGKQFNADMARQLQLPRQAIEGLINDAVLLAEARKMGLSVTDREVRDTILSIPGIVDEQGRFIDEETYKRFATNNKYASPAEFEQTVRDDLLRQKLFDVLASNALVTDAETEQAYREEVERAAVRFVQVPRGTFAEAATATAEQLQSWYEQHQDKLPLPEQRVAQYLLVDQALLRAQLEISDADLQAYYDAHPDEFRREEQVRARHILLRTDRRSADEASAELEQIKARIEGGEDFATVAEEVSEDPASAQQGGDLGYFGRGRMVPEFEQAAFDAQPGTIVGPVVSSFGAHLILVEDRQEAGEIPFEEAKATARNRVAAERIDQESTTLAESLRKQLEDAGEGDPTKQMETLADENPSVRFATTQPFGQTDLVTGLGRVPAFAEAAFSLDEGELAEGVVDTPRGPAILRLSEVRAPRVPPLDEVEARVRREVEQEQQQTLAVERLEQAKARLDEGATLDDVAAELGVEVGESGEFGANDPIQGLGFDPELNQAALGAEVGDVLGPLPTAQGAALMEVTERTGFDPQVFAERRAEIRKRLERERSDRLLSSLVQRRRQELGVSYDPQLIQEFDLAGPSAS